MASPPCNNNHESHARSSLQPWLDAGLLWFAGFRDACCLHRAFIFCKRSQKVFIKTGQCFLLNGCIFLGSIIALQTFVIPALNWLLASQHQSSIGPDHNKGIEGSAAEGFLLILHSVLVHICYVFWLYPLYIISFVINYIWYNEIAQQAFEAIQQSQNKYDLQPGQQVSKSTRNTDDQKNGGILSIISSLGEQIYSVIMLSIFFIEIFLVSFIPYIGHFLNFFLLSWLYAYYCFDYKWGFARWSLERRLAFFESNWAFFAGFGSPYVLATLFFTPFVRCGVVAILFPLFVLVATASHPELVVASCIGSREPALKRLPVFHTANALTLPILRLLQQGLMILFASKKKSL